MTPAGRWPPASLAAGRLAARREPRVNLPYDAQTRRKLAPPGASALQLAISVTTSSRVAGSPTNDKSACWVASRLASSAMPGAWATSSSRATRSAASRSRSSSAAGSALYRYGCTLTALVQPALAARIWTVCCARSAREQKISAATQPSARSHSQALRLGLATRGQYALAIGARRRHGSGFRVS